MVKKWAVKNTNTNDLVTQGLKTKREAEGKEIERTGQKKETEGKIEAH